MREVYNKFGSWITEVLIAGVFQLERDRERDWTTADYWARYAPSRAVKSLAAKDDFHSSPFKTADQCLR